MLELALIIVLAFIMVVTMINSFRLKRVYRKELDSIELKSKEVITRYTRRSEENVENYQASLEEMMQKHKVSLERIKQGYLTSVADMGRMYTSALEETTQEYRNRIEGLEVRYKNQYDSMIRMVREMQHGHICQIQEVETIITQRYMDGSVMIKRNVFAG